MNLKLNKNQLERFSRQIILKKIGICGQAPSDYPEFTKFLVKSGINSISLMPDSLIRTKINIKEIEDSTL